MIRVIFILLITILFISESNAAEKLQGIYLGFGVPNYEFKVSDSSKNIESSMVSSNKTSYTVGYTKLPTPLLGNYIRWSLEGSYAPFNSNRQIVSRVTDATTEEKLNGQNEVNLNSEMKGFVAFINPTLDLYLPVNDDYFFYAGVGYGVGYANIKGTYFDTESIRIANCKTSTTKATIIQNCTKVSQSFNKVDFAVNILLVLNLNAFLIRLENGGPTIEASNKTFNIYNSKASIAYHYRF